jgi:hypothetical protein
LKPKTKKAPPSKPEDFQSFKDYCEHFYPIDKFPRKKRCPHPNCPENDRDHGYPGQHCVLNDPIWISIPVGEHIHLTCPVHPCGHILRGPDVHWGQPKVTWDDIELWKKQTNLPERWGRENNLPDPDYSKIGKVWM